MDPQSLMIYAAAAAAAVFGGKWLFTKDTQIEERRRHVQKMVAKLREMGLTKLPNLLDDYVVGDYSGMIHKVKDLYELLMDDKARVAEFEKVANLVLEYKMKNPETRDALIAKVENLRHLYDPTFTKV